MQHLDQYKMLYDQAQHAYERYVEGMTAATPAYAATFPSFKQLPGDMMMSWIRVVQPFFQITEN